MSCKPPQDHCYYTGAIFSLQFHQKPFGGRALPGPAGELERSPDLIAAIGGLLYSKGRGREGRDGKGKDGRGLEGREGRGRD